MPLPSSVTPRLGRRPGRRWPARRQEDRAAPRILFGALRLVAVPVVLLSHMLPQIASRECVAWRWTTRINSRSSTSRRHPTPAQNARNTTQGTPRTSRRPGLVASSSSRYWALARVLLSTRTRGTRRAAKARIRPKRIEVLGDPGHRVHEQRAQRKRRMHAVDLDSAQHLDVLSAEPARTPDLVDRLSLIGTLVKEMPDVLAIGLVGDTAEWTDPAPQSLSQPGCEYAEGGRHPIARSDATRGVARWCSTAQSQRQTSTSQMRRQQRPSADIAVPAAGAVASLIASGESTGVRCRQSAAVGSYDRRGVLTRPWGLAGGLAAPSGTPVPHPRLDPLDPQLWSQRQAVR